MLYETHEIFILLVLLRRSCTAVRVLVGRINFILFAASLHGVTIFLINILCQLCPTWSDWSLWSMCDAECGGGRRERQRECDFSAYFRCDGNAVEYEACNTQVNRIKFQNQVAGLIFTENFLELPIGFQRFFKLILDHTPQYHFVTLSCSLLFCVI